MPRPHGRGTRLTTTMNALINRYNALPRAGKWLTWLVAVIVAYFGVIEPSLVATQAARARADALAAGLEKERALTSADSDQGRILESGRRSFGEPMLPEDALNKPEALHTLVDRILETHRVSSRVKNERRIRIAGDEAIKLLGPLAGSSAVERLILEVSFEASPEVVSAVLADLEKAKEVATIGRIDIRRQESGGRGSAPASGSKILKATISPESWVLTRVATTGLVGGAQ